MSGVLSMAHPKKIQVWASNGGALLLPPLLPGEGPPMVHPALVLREMGFTVFFFGGANVRAWGLRVANALFN